MGNGGDGSWKWERRQMGDGRPGAGRGTGGAAEGPRLSPSLGRGGRFGGRVAG